MRIASFPQRGVPAELHAQSLALKHQAWPLDGDEPPQEHDPGLDPVSVLLVNDDVVVACLDILSKQISHRGQSFLAKGLSTVVTDPAQRGRGYGRRLVTEARELIAASGADLGIFTSDRPLASFYQSAGWQLLPETVLLGGTPDSPYPSDQFDKVTLAAFFTGHARRYAKTFDHERIALYPGNIDKLW
jgi:aminoglycoside 2'-N-acetyltransferase I